jgi:hypothetical protein
MTEPLRAPSICTSIFERGRIIHAVNGVSFDVYQAAVGLVGEAGVARRPRLAAFSAWMITRRIELEGTDLRRSLPRAHWRISRWSSRIRTARSTRFLDPSDAARALQCTGGFGNLAAGAVQRVSLETNIWIGCPINWRWAEATAWLEQ